MSKLIILTEVEIDTNEILKSGRTIEEYLDSVNIYNNGNCTGFEILDDNLDDKEEIYMGNVQILTKHVVD